MWVIHVAYLVGNSVKLLYGYHKTIGHHLNLKGKK